MNIGARIQEYRIKNNLSVDDLASKLSVSNNTITNWEANKSVPNESKLYELAAIFKVSLDEFLGTEKDKYITPETKVQKNIMMGIKVFNIFGYIFSVLIVIIIIYGFISMFLD